MNAADDHFDAHDVAADQHAARSLHWHRVQITLRQIAEDLAALADALDAAADEGGER